MTVSYRDGLPGGYSFGEIEDVSRGGEEPGRHIVDKGTVWIAGGDGMLSRSIAVSNSVEEPIAVGAYATDVAVDYDSVWVTVDAP